MALIVEDCDDLMKKRRVLMELDDDLVELLKAAAEEGGDVSVVLSETVREPLESMLHRRALYAWMEELNEKHGHPSEADFEWARAVLDEARGTHADGAGEA